MTPLCVTNGDVTAAHLHYLEVARRLVVGMRDFLSCHEVCAALALKFPEVWEHHRGKFNGVWDHSWLVFRESPGVILDPYPWACASGPLLIVADGYYLNPWRKLYAGKPVNMSHDEVSGNHDY